MAFVPWTARMVNTNAESGMLSDFHRTSTFSCHSTKGHHNPPQEFRIYKFALKTTTKTSNKQTVKSCEVHLRSVSFTLRNSSLTSLRGHRGPGGQRLKLAADFLNFLNTEVGPGENKQALKRATNIYQAERF